MATYRLVRRRGPIEVPTPAPQAQPEPERNLGGASLTCGSTTAHQALSAPDAVWIATTPAGCRASREQKERTGSSLTRAFVRLRWTTTGSWLAHPGWPHSEPQCRAVCRFARSLTCSESPRRSLHTPTQSPSPIRHNLGRCGSSWMTMRTDHVYLLTTTLISSSIFLAVSGSVLTRPW